MFSFFLLDFLFMKLNEEKWKRPFSKFTFNRHQHKMSIRQQWKNDRGSKGWRSGESNRPPVLWPGLQILASKRYVSGSLPGSKTYSFCRFPDFPLSLKTDTQHSMWKAWARLHKFFTTSKCFVAKKSQFTILYDRHYRWIVLESLSDETKQRKFHLKNSKSQPPSTTLLS